MAEKKLKKAFSRATSSASLKSNDDENSFGRVMSGSFSRVMSGSSATFSRVMSGSSQQFSSLQRSLGSLGATSEAVFGRVSSSETFQRTESFQRAPDATNTSRLQKKESALDEVLPLLSGAAKLPQTGSEVQCYFGGPMLFWVFGP